MEKCSRGRQKGIDEQRYVHRWKNRDIKHRGEVNRQRDGEVQLQKYEI